MPDMTDQWQLQMNGRSWPEYIRVLACLQLHSLQLGREMCTMEDRGRRVLLRSVDIARMTGLARSNVRRGIAWLERVGFCTRIAVSGSDQLKRGDIGIMCWQRPQEHVPGFRLPGASDSPTA